MNIYMLRDYVTRIFSLGSMYTDGQIMPRESEVLREHYVNVICELAEEYHPDSNFDSQQDAADKWAQVKRECRSKYENDGKIASIKHLRVCYMMDLLSAKTLVDAWSMRENWRFRQ